MYTFNDVVGKMANGYKGWSFKDINEISNMGYGSFFDLMDKFSPEGSFANPESEAGISMDN